MLEKEKKIKKKTLGNYPFLSVIFSVSLSLFLLGIFSILLISSYKMKLNIQKNIELNIYLNKVVSINDIERINKIILSKNYVLNKDESSVIFISKEKAANEYSNELGEDFIKFLGQNPLRDLFVLKIDQDYFEGEKLLEIEKDLMEINGIYEITYPKDLIDDINNNVNKIGLMLIVIFFILLFISSILINNTIRLALFSQRFLIRSMQLVGATSLFIQKPFLIRGVIYGIISGILSSVLLFIILMFLNSRMENIMGIIDSKSFLIISLNMILIGILIVSFSTYNSVNKYLNSSLDDLY